MKSSMDYDRELRDPALTALLQDAFADDPALAPAPGRSERIMRSVLVANVRRPRPIWAPFAWASGAVALAGLAVLLAIGMPRKAVTPFPQVADNIPTQSRQPSLTHEKSPRLPVLPAPVEKTHAKWESPTAHDDSVTTDMHAGAPSRPATEATSTQVASALYSAGSTALASGDYETAYEAYQASYETLPTPDAILASAQALQRITDTTPDTTETIPEEPEG